VEQAHRADTNPYINTYLLALLLYLLQLLGQGHGLKYRLKTNKIGGAGFTSRSNLKFLKIRNKNSKKTRVHFKIFAQNEIKKIGVMCNLLK
jgi:hypothetical protein